MNRRSFLLSTALVLGAMSSGVFYWPKRWNYIVIHHSAGNYGDIPFLQKIHRERQANDPVDAIPYHYIIGNGNGLGLGEIDGDWRQAYHIWGAHVSAKNSDRNFRGIGVCLIGNYETTEVPEKQYEALVTLTRQLMADHNIPVTNVSGHGYIAGESTRCPGKNFPMESFLKDIS